MNIINQIKNYFRGSIYQKNSERGQSYLPVSGRRIGWANNGQDMTLLLCCKILADAMSCVRYSLFDREKNKIDDSFMRRVMRVEPNEWQNAASFWYSMEFCRNYFGNAYAYLRWGKAGYLDALIPLDPRYMKVYVNDGGEFMDVKVIYEYTDPRTKRIYTLLPEELLHFKANSQDGIVGIGAPDLLRDIIDENNMAQGYIKEIYKNGFEGVMTLTYASDLNAEKRKNLYAQLNEVLNNQGDRMLALPPGVDAKVLGSNGINSAYVDLRDRGARKIAGFMGIPQFLLDDSASGSGAAGMTSAQQSAFYAHTLRPRIHEYACELSRKLLRFDQKKSGIYIDEEDIAGFAFLSATEKTENYVRLAAAGILTVNEVRAELGYNHYFDEAGSGDLLYRNGAFTSADNGDSTGDKTEKIKEDNAKKAAE